jgi:DNA replication and repair protein RecF
MRRRVQLVEDLTPLVGKAYEAVARGASLDDAVLLYKPSLALPADGNLEEAILAELERRRAEEFDRGLTLVGPHRDDILLSLGDLPVKGYASHGECWSFALALRLASYDLLRADGDDPVLILDDVFAELDRGRRAQLADLVAGAEQVLITAAVPEDIPAQLHGRRFTVVGGEVILDG